VLTITYEWSTLETFKRPFLLSLSMGEEHTIGQLQNIHRNFVTVNKPGFFGFILHHSINSRATLEKLVRDVYVIGHVGEIVAKGLNLDHQSPSQLVDILSKQLWYTDLNVQLQFSPDDGRLLQGDILGALPKKGESTFREDIMRLYVDELDKHNKKYVEEINQTPFVETIELMEQKRKDCVAERDRCGYGWALASTGDDKRWLIALTFLAKTEKHVTPDDSIDSKWAFNDHEIYTKRIKDLEEKNINLLETSLKDMESRLEDMAKDLDGLKKIHVKTLEDKEKLEKNVEELTDKLSKSRTRVETLCSYDNIEQVNAYKEKVEFAEVAKEEAEATAKEYIEISESYENDIKEAAHQLHEAKMEIINLRGIISSYRQKEPVEESDVQILDLREIYSAAIEEEGYNFDHLEALLVGGFSRLSYIGTKDRDVRYVLRHTVAKLSGKHRTKDITGLISCLIGKEIIVHTKSGNTDAIAINSNLDSLSPGHLKDYLVAMVEHYGAVRS
jgi:TolA-binding protein